MANETSKAYKFSLIAWQLLGYALPKILFMDREKRLYDLIIIHW